MKKNQEEMSIEDEIKGLLNPVDDIPAEEEAEEGVEDQPSEGVETPENVAEAPPETTESDIEAPVSLSKAAKEKWKELPKEIKEEWAKRENDMHRTMTSHDGDLNMGRQMKEVISPYMAIIQAEGGTPVGAVKDLLNTAYVLRTGTPSQKVQLLHQVAQQYGVDLGQSPQNSQHDPIAALQDQIHQLKQQADPNVLKTQLQEEFTRDNIQREVSDFAANTQNVHFHTVRSAMGPLMMSGQAKNLQEAYDMACWANPSIRSTMLNAQEAEKQAKQKREIEAKKKAAASVTGSPGLTSPSDRTPTKSLEDEIREQLQEARGAVV